MKIPDDVFENRCRYCLHGRTEAGNKDIPAEWLWKQSHRKDLSCNIFGISQCDKIAGECLSFMPNRIYGICYSCEHNNSFFDGFCMREEQPNKRQIFIGCGGLGGAAKPDYWREHILSTCDAYRPSRNWMDIMRREAAEGKIPRNFDPETMKAIGETTEGDAERKWTEYCREQEKAREAQNKAKTGRDTNQNTEQMTLF